MRAQPISYTSGHCLEVINLHGALLGAFGDGLTLRIVLTTPLEFLSQIGAVISDRYKVFPRQELFVEKTRPY